MSHIGLLSSPTPQEHHELHPKICQESNQYRPSHIRKVLVLTSLSINGPLEFKPRPRRRFAANNQTSENPSLAHGQNELPHNGHRDCSWGGKEGHEGTEEEQIVEDGEAVGGGDLDEGAVSEEEISASTLELAAYPNYASRDVRMKTFDKVWSPRHPQRPENLVDEGFFYAGYSDCCRCFYCGLGLVQWRPTHDANYQHAKFRPTCAYVRLFMGQEYVDNVERETSNTPIRPISHPRIQVSSRMLRLGWSEDQISRALNHVVSELGEDLLTPDVVEDVLRTLNTSTSYPVVQSTSGTDATAKGRSSEDTVQTDSQGDVVDGPIARNVTAQHGHGRNDHGNWTESRDQTQTSEANEFNASSSQDQASIVSGPAKDVGIEMGLDLMEREHKYFMERLICSECHENKVNTIYMPCGHTIACKECAEDTNICGTCNKRILATAPIFFS